MVLSQIIDKACSEGKVFIGSVEKINAQIYGKGMKPSIISLRE